MLDDYLKTNPGVKDLPRPGIKPLLPNPHPCHKALSYDNPIFYAKINTS